MHFARAAQVAHALPDRPLRPRFLYACRRKTIRTRGDDVFRGEEIDPPPDEFDGPTAPEPLAVVGVVAQNEQLDPEQAFGNDQLITSRPGKGLERLLRVEPERGTEATGDLDDGALTDRDDEVGVLGRAGDSVL